VTTFYPSYLDLINRGELEERRKILEEILSECALCPRECGVNRTEGEEGFCRTAMKIPLASYGPHFGEEFPLVGRCGSGTVFFSHCNLGCIFCQNYDISHGHGGSLISPSHLAEVFLEIEERGCHNLNLVTPTHVIPQILEALQIAVMKGFFLPLVYNCGGYESRKVIELLSGVVDVYMPDFKFMDDSVALRLTGARDYVAHAKEAVEEMYRQVGDLKTDTLGIARRGMIVRHLLLPGGISGISDLLEYLAEALGPGIYLNIMDQYRPCYRAWEYPPLEGRVSRMEWENAVSLAKELGFTRVDGVEP